MYQPITAEEISRRVAVRLYEWRVDAKLTLASVGRQLGVTAQFVSGLELRKKHPSRRMIANVANLLQKPLEELLAPL